MEAVEQAEGAESPAQTRPKRSRTGCLTCRTRRRKCDENKPTCQNCTSKGFECRYAAPFQILGKNNFTPEVSTNVKYKNLRFVSADGEKQSENHDEANTMEAEVHEEDRLSELSVNPASPREENRIAKTQRPGDASLEKSPTVDNYEFALHGLLALGAGSSENLNTITSPTPDNGLANGISAQVTHHETTEMQAPVMQERSEEECIDRQKNTQVWRLFDIPESLGSNILPQERHLELLKCYRYGVAPWLDICDMTQTFGCEVVQLSTESTPIRYELLALAESSCSAREDRRTDAETSSATLLTSLRQQQYEELDDNHKALCSILSTIRIMIMDIDDFWSQGNVFFTNDNLESLLQGIMDCSLTRSIYWLSVRIQLGIALVASTPLRIPHPFSVVMTETGFEAMNTDNVSKFATQALALCVDAIMFCQNDQDELAKQRYGRSRVEAWTTLVRGLEDWYVKRPQEFQTIIELYPKDGWRSDDEFPTLVFTGGAAILANQLCHTGMLLLLQNRPRFVGRVSATSSFMATLWHARRICGISMNNDRRECWDPCLLASFLVAAQTATHRSQHNAITATIQNVQKLTGWNISRQLQRLKEDWRMAEGW